MVMVLKHVIFHVCLGFFLQLLSRWMHAVSDTESPLTILAVVSWLLGSTVDCTGKGDEQVETEGKTYPQGHIWV